MQSRLVVGQKLCVAGKNIL